MTQLHHPTHRDRALRAVRAATFLISSVVATCMVLATHQLQVANPTQAARPPGAHTANSYTAEGSTAPGGAR
jgi:hypothetical protein